MPAPSTIDVLTPFDPSAYSSISGSQLEQFGSGIIPYLDKGLCMVTTDVAGVPSVPNANTATKWKNYLWIRQSATTASAYVWANGGPSDSTFLQWISLAAAGIGVGSITGLMIALNTITDANISDVNYSKISGAPTNLPPSGAAGGDLAGNYPNPSVAVGAITASKVANATLTPAQIAPGTALGFLQTNAGASSVNWVVASSIASLVNGVTTTGNQFKIPQVATAGAGDSGTWQMVSPGALLQSAQVTFTSTPTALNAVGTGSAIINVAHGLGSIPLFARGVLVCTTGEAGYTAGDEVDCMAFAAAGGGGVFAQNVFSVGASATNVFMTQCLTVTNIEVNHKTTGALTVINVAHWNAKIYARL